MTFQFIRDALTDLLPKSHSENEVCAYQQRVWLDRCEVRAVHVVLVIVETMLVVHLSATYRSMKNIPVCLHVLNNRQKSLVSDFALA